jgi:hypothetical protein
MTTTNCYWRDIPGGVTLNVNVSNDDTREMLLHLRTRE